MVCLDLTAVMEFLVLLVFRASVAHVGALGCRACQAFLGHQELLAMTVNLALPVNQAPWALKATPVPTDPQVLSAKLGRMATTELLVLLVVVDLLATLDLKAPKDRREHLGQTALFVALPALPALLLLAESIPLLLPRLHKNPRQNRKVHHRHLNIHQPLNIHQLRLHLRILLQRPQVLLLQNQSLRETIPRHWLR